MAKLRIRSAYEACLEVCGHLEHPGLGIDMPIWVDHTQEATTVDQARIEDALEGMALAGRRILHVGVGNSQFAKRFGPRVRLIDGLTVSEAEKALADSLHLANYSVFLLNKYGREFLQRIGHRYDYVIDNNLASFACCKYHFHHMLDNYLWSLEPGGSILTEQAGMDWTVGNDPRWQLRYGDLEALQDKFPVEAWKATDTVYGLRRLR